MTKKTEPQVLATLKDAIEEERVQTKRHLARYEELTQKMKQYQEGTGPAPTLDEFEQWRKDVDEYVAINLLHSGISLPS